MCFENVAKLIEKQRNAEALARAQAGFDAADAADKGLGDELARLKEQATRVQKADGVEEIMKKIQQNLDTLRVYNTQLKSHRDKLAEVVRRENDPNANAAAVEIQAEAINTRITVLLSRGDVDEALAAYDQLFALLPTNVEIKTRKDKLAAEWKVKDEAHQKARDYLLKTWPAIGTIQDFNDALPQIRSAVDVCKKHNDKLTLRKLLTLFTPATVKLNDLVTPLDPASEADRKLFKVAETIGKTMAAMEREIRKFAEE